MTLNEGAPGAGPSGDAGPAEGNSFGMVLESGAPGLSDAPPNSTPADSNPAGSGPSAPAAAPGTTTSTGGDPASAAAAAAAVQAAPFVFMGRQFRDQAHAEQSFRTVEGIGRKNQELRMSLLERDNALARLREENQRLQQGAASGTKPEGAQPAGGQPKPGESAGGTAEVVKLFEVLAEKHGLGAAVGFLLTEQQKATQAAVTAAVEATKQELSGLMEPLRASHAEQQEIEYADRLIAGVAALRTETGQQAFPELADAQKVGEISTLMHELGFEREHMLSPKVVMAAVALYRMKHQWAAGQVAIPGSGSTTTTPSAAALAAAASVSGVSGDPPARSPEPKSEEQRIREEMLRSAVGNADTSFGGMRL